jgi:hypothetical protein
MICSQKRIPRDSFLLPFLARHFLVPTPILNIRALLAVVLAFGTATGCSNSSNLDPLERHAGRLLATKPNGVSTAGYGSASFYPLEIGNEWTYGGHISFVSFGAHPTPQGDTLVSLEFTESHRLVGAEEREGRSYLVREEYRAEAEPFGSETVTWSRLRQDRTGLYAADVDASEPPSAVGSPSTSSIRTLATERLATTFGSALAAKGVPQAAIERLQERWENARAAVRGSRTALTRGGGPLGGELTWLQYPLRPGTGWDIRSDFPWPAHVDRIEVLYTPAGRMPAYRIETDPFGTTVGQGEWIRLWYGRSGYLGYSIHLVEPLTSQGDAYTVIDDSMFLTAVHLQER